jgi:HD superfamily phosphohydrolase
LAKVQPDLDINDEIVKAITLAGLLHDLGHGPFSHLFDHCAAAKIGCPDYKHETQSARLVEHIVDRMHIDIEPSTVRLIQSLILGDSTAHDYKWIFDIVCNKRNSVDVDKFDYISRDTHMLGV